MRGSLIDDPLLTDVAPEPAFDRFYFNLHGREREPFLVLGGGVYPTTQLIDGYVVAAVHGRQRNLRFSDHFDLAAPREVGPFRWEVVEPYQEWRLVLAPNPTGLEFDLIWRARARPYAIERYEVDDDEGSSSQAHFFQSGTYDGVLRVDGVEEDIGGFLGQRDRSRGNRRVSDRLGMHLWVQAQFHDASLGFLFNTDRQGSTTHCHGALMREDGTIDEIVDVRHDLTFDEGLGFVDGLLEIQLADAGAIMLTATSTGPGIYMSGAGIGGWHGQDHGPRCIEHEDWPLDGSLAPRDFDTSLCQALARFEMGDQRGIGVFEYGITRSRAYSYRPTTQEVHG